MDISKEHRVLDLWEIALCKFEEYIYWSIACVLSDVEKVRMCLDRVIYFDLTFTFTYSDAGLATLLCRFRVANVPKTSSARRIPGRRIDHQHDSRASR